MPKKALIVEYSIRTRVIVDIPGDAITFEAPVELFDMIAEAAAEHIMDNGAGGYLLGENISTIELDTELPYGALEDEE